MNIKHNITSLLCGLALLAATASSHAAALLTLNYSGTFGPTTTLGSTAFGENTPFSFAATFDPDAPLGGPFDGWQQFSATSFTILIKGTTYTATTLTDLNVTLWDTRSLGNYFAGLVDTVHSPSGVLMGSFFSVATPSSFDADKPTPTVFSDFSYSDLRTGFQIALVGVDGGLAINDLVGPSAASLSAVPEPSEWTAISFAVIGLAYAAKRRLTKAAH